MGVDLRHENEGGELLAEIGDPKNLFAVFLDAERERLNNTACLQYVDRYGDTTFNQRQLPALITELDRWARGVADQALASHLCSMLELARNAHGQVHTYLRFVGD